jgi:MFS family permease
MGVLAALEFAPGLLFGLVAGVWLDRTRRRPVLVASQLAAAAALATVPLAAALHVLTIQQLFAVAFVSGTAATFFGVAQIAFLPALVGRDRLLEANAHYQTSRTAAALLGPGLAGAAVQLLTAPVAIAVDACSFLVGAATAAWLRTAEPAPARGPRRGVAGEAIEGLALVWRLPLVRAITGTLVVANMGGGMANAVLVLLFVGQIGLPPAQFGLVFVASSASSLAGSVLIRPLQRRAGLGPAMVMATVLVGAGGLVRVAAAFTRPPVTFPLLVAGALVGGFGLMTYNVPQQTIQQAVIPDRLLGRTSAGVALAIYTGSVAAALAGGLLGQVAGLRTTLVVASAITVVCALPTALGPVRALRALPDLRPSPRPSSAA